MSVQATKVPSVIAGSCAIKTRKPRQVRKEAAVANSSLCVQGCPAIFLSGSSPLFYNAVSYLVLARKARPQRFAEVIGQRAVVRTLKNALAQDRVPHALIFSGVRGTGKTTLARIMAKALNCSGRQGVEPCNECQSCREIAAGTSVDLKEVDGASNRGIQEIRELKEGIRFQPSSSRYKIFIIDEVHMLTTEAFNALLKTLEEPPEHVYFMFATTELHKVPLTILSRCQRFELKRLPLAELRDHFAQLADREGIRISPKALDMVAREAAGSVRDGLSLLDQVFSYCGQEVSEADVQDVLGLVSRQAVAELGTALLEADLGRAFTLLGALQDQGLDLKRLASDLLHWFRELLLCSLGPKTEALLALTEDELAALRALVAPYDQDRLSAISNLLMDAMAQPNAGRDPRLALEMAFIRAVQVAEVTPTAELISRFNELLGDAPLPAESGTAAKRTAPARTAAAPAKPLPAKAGPLPEVPPTEAAARHPDGEQAGANGPDMPPLPNAPPFDETPPDCAPGPPPAIEAVPPPAGLPAAADMPQASSAAAPDSPVDSNALARRLKAEWQDFTEQVRKKMPWMGLSLQRALSKKVHGTTLTVLFADLNDCIMLKQAAHTEELTTFVQAYFQAPLSVQIEEERAGTEDVNPLTGRTSTQERKALAAEPVVLTTLEVMAGQLGDIRISTGSAGKTAAGPDASAMDGFDSALPQEDDE